MTAKLSILFVTAAAALGQVTSGSISGYVSDPSERPIAKAEVEVTDSLHSLSRRTLTDSSGFYVLPGLEPASYAISARAPGFHAARADVVLEVNARARADFRLNLQGQTQTIEVAAIVSPVESQSAELGLILDRRRIESLPLNRRGFLQLSLLTAGVAPPAEDSELSTRGGFAMHANGAREDFNNFLLDGVDNNDQNNNRYVLQPSVDAVQEFQIATNAYSAEFGRNAGGQVNVVTLRGGNEFHGAVYEYFRNRHLDARNFFDGPVKQKFNMNQFGASAGGPLARERTFFFANADFLRLRQGLSRLASVPLMAERGGDLSGLGKAVIDPFTRQPFSGNIIPASRISPVGKKVLALYPQPNRPGVSGNYLGTPVASESRSQGIARLDHHLTARDTLTARYGRERLDLFEPYAEDTGAVPGFGDTLGDTGQNLMLHHQRAVSAATLQSLRFGYNRFARELTPESGGLDAPAYLGVDWLKASDRDRGFPAFNVAGYSRVGDITSLPIYRHSNTAQLVEALSLVRGRHVLKLGGEWRRFHYDNRLYLLTRGSLSFSGALSGAGIGDLLLGIPSFGLQAKADNPQDLRSSTWGAYLQDDWKLSPRLTLNLGVRYDYNTPPVDPNDGMTKFDLTSGSVVRVGTNGVSRSGIDPDRNNFAPRIGVAWTPAADTVVRAGYGLYYEAGMMMVNSAQYFNPPQFTLRVYFPSAQWIPTLSNPFPSTGGFAPPPSLNTIAPDLTAASMQHWNLTLQRSLGRLGSVSAAYAGSKGTHLIRSRDLNQPAPATGDVQARRPYRAYGNILFIDSGANSSFHSMQLTFNRPMTRGLSLWSVYTFGKSIDDTSAFLTTKADKNFPQNSRDFAAERGLSSFDVAHRFVAAPIYALPSGSRWTRNTEVRSIVSLNSGRPFTPLLRFDNSNTGNTGGSFGSDRPDLLRDPRLASPGPDRWFDTDAFRVPARYTFGSAGRNIVRGPGYASVDLSIVRRFYVSEGVFLQFEAEAFNVQNRANFDLPEVYADEPASFGRIFSARLPRQVQFALRLGF